MPRKSSNSSLKPTAVSSLVLSDDQKRYHYDNFGTAEAPEIDFDDIINSGLLDMMNNLFKPKKGSRKRTRYPNMGGMPNFNRLFKGMENLFEDLGGDDGEDYDVDIDDMYYDAEFEKMFGKDDGDMMNFMFKMNKPPKPKKKTESEDEWEDVDEE